MQGGIGQQGLHAPFSGGEDVAGFAVHGFVKSGVVGIPPQGFNPHVIKGFIGVICGGVARLRKHPVQQPREIRMGGVVGLAQTVGEDISDMSGFAHVARPLVDIYPEEGINSDQRGEVTCLQIPGFGQVNPHAEEGQPEVNLVEVVEFPTALMAIESHANRPGQIFRQDRCTQRQGGFRIDIHITAAGDLPRQRDGRPGIQGIGVRKPILLHEGLIL